MSKSKNVVRKKLGILNVEMTVSDNEVRIWGCDPKKGISVFRVKAMGKVRFNKELADIMVVPK